MSLTLYVAHGLVFNLVVDWLGWIEPGGLGRALTFAAGLLGDRDHRGLVVARPLRHRSRRVALPPARRVRTYSSSNVLHCCGSPVS